jgi:hypothetical protein
MDVRQGVTLREEHRLKVLNKVFGSKRDEETGLEKTA